jgi:hypothetical protein
MAALRLKRLPPPPTHPSFPRSIAHRRSPHLHSGVCARRRRRQPVLLRPRQFAGTASAPARHRAVPSHNPPAREHSSTHIRPPGVSTLVPSSFLSPALPIRPPVRAGGRNLWRLCKRVCAIVHVCVWARARAFDHVFVRMLPRVVARAQMLLCRSKGANNHEPLCDWQRIALQQPKRKPRLFAAQTAEELSAWMQAIA